MSNNITFRTKFENKIRDSDERQVIEDIFEDFMNLNEESALDCLWHLTYKPKNISYVFQELYLNDIQITGELLLALRNELRYQYTQLHPGFPFVDVPEICLDVFSALQNHSNIITAVVVYEHCCFNRYKMGKQVKHTLALLNNANELSILKGIRSLGFNEEEANYLKPWHFHIYKLLNVMSRHEKELFKPKNLFPDNEDLPFVCEMPLTAENILKFRGLFFSFAVRTERNAITEIANAGFNPNQVLSKKTAIFNFLKAAEALDK